MNLAHRPRPPHILWLGPVVSEEVLITRPAVSPAANRWQAGLIAGLQASGLRVIVIGHIPEPVWPRGQLFVSPGEHHLADGLEGQLVRYLNLPWLRENNLADQYLAAFKRICRHQGIPQFIISYNPYVFNYVTGQYAQNRMGIPWVCVVADAPVEQRRLREHVLRVKQSTGLVFLSRQSYEISPAPVKLHLDGGVANLHFPNDMAVEKSEIPGSVLYSGTMSKYGGVEYLARAFRLVKSPTARLWICGQGSNPVVDEIASIDSRITVYGLVPEARLRQLYETAQVFVNPRPSSIPENHVNFPSKVLEYLSYGKPVISTWTHGLSPEYREAMIVLQQETDECLAETIDDVLSWSESRRQDWANQMCAFMYPNKMWQTQAKRLMDWLFQEVVAG